MKQAVKSYEFSLKKEVTMGVFYQLFFLMLGFIFSKGSISKEFSPFGSSIVASVPKKYILTSAVGAIIGYLFPIGDLSGFKYMASVFAVALIRYSISGFSKLYKHPAISGIVSFCSVLFTGIAVIADNSSLTLKIIAEAFLSAAGAYFLNIAFKIKPYKKSGLSLEQLVSICFLLSIVVLGFMPIGIDDVSFGRIFAILFILLAAKFGGAAIGSMAGVLFGFVVTIGYSKADFGLFYMAAGGLFAGFFSTFGKLASVISFFVVALISSAFLNNGSLMVILIECLIASGVFFAFTQKAFTVSRWFVYEQATANQPKGNKGRACYEIKICVRGFRKCKHHHKRGFK